MGTEEKEEYDSKGAEWIGIGLSIGLGIGVAFGVALDNIAMGVAFGPAIGMLFGVAMMSAKRAEGEDDTSGDDAK